MRTDRKKSRSLKRREFLQLSGAGAVASGATFAPSPDKKALPAKSRGEAAGRAYNGAYAGEHLNRVAFPLGGLGAGMLCLEGTGALSHVSLRNKPDVFHEPCVFAAVGIKGDTTAARVLEGPVPRWKLFGPPEAGNGAGGKSYGLPRFATATFLCRFPFATVSLSDPKMPLEVEVTAWSPFEPGDADGSSLPVAALEYRFHNRSKATVDAVFSFNAINFMALKDRPKAVKAHDRGFLLWGGTAKDKPWEEGTFCASVADPQAKVNAAWFRGGWFDPLTLAWKDVADAACFDRPPVAEGAPSPGASLFVPVVLAPGESRTVAVRLSWYVGDSDLRSGKDPAGTPTSDPPERFRPWYAGRFAGIGEVNRYFADHYDALRAKAARFRDCFYDTTLPPELVEAVAANLTILKSPTVLRQTDGRLWAWEGCSDGAGCCSGSCTHVWNYAQALPHLFPDLERTLRETEFGPSQAETGHQAFPFGRSSTTSTPRRTGSSAGS
jgi:beta-glucosidase 2, glycosyl-hydrolase family 116 N-term